MPRITIYNHVSADGYFSTQDGKLDWVIQDQEIAKAGAAAASAEGVMLFGRRTYQMFESYWPHALDQLSGPHGGEGPRGAGGSADSLRAMATWINASKKLVFSRTLEGVTWNNSELIHEFDPRQIEALKRSPGRDMIVFGSGSIASLLTEHGLVDEYHFVISPLILGSGRPLLSGIPKSTKLKLVESTSFPTGNVVLRYERASES